MDATLICKAIASVAIASAVGVVGYKTASPMCLWGLFFAACIW